MEHRHTHWRRWWTLWLCIGALLWADLFAVVTRADSTIATTWTGMRSASSLSASAVCRNTGHESVWVAETGTAFLDIIQVGDLDGTLFYAYGRGVPNGPDSLYIERHLGPAGTGPHRYGVTLAAHRWTLTIDGRIVARITDSFRTWRLHETQVMAEGILPFGRASCVAPAGRWYFGGYGPQPQWSILGPYSWSVS